MLQNKYYYILFDFDREVNLKIYKNYLIVRSSRYSNTLDNIYFDFFFGIQRRKKNYSINIIYCMLPFRFRFIYIFIRNEVKFKCMLVE